MSCEATMLDFKREKTKIGGRPPTSQESFQEAIDEIARELNASRDLAKELQAFLEEYQESPSGSMEESEQRITKMLMKYYRNMVK